MSSLVEFGGGLRISSRDISLETGKRHPDVKRDILNMCDSLEISASRFAHTYQDVQNKSQVEFMLDRDTALCLASGYNAKLRMKIIKRMNELEPAKLPMSSGAENVGVALLNAVHLLQDEVAELKVGLNPVKKKKKVNVLPVWRADDLQRFLSSSWVRPDIEPSGHVITVGEFFAVYSEWCSTLEGVYVYRCIPTFMRAVLRLRPEWKARKHRMMINGVRHQVIFGLYVGR